MKKVLSFVLFMAMILTLTALSTSAAAWDGTTASASLKGDGTQESPYLVETAEDLAFLAKSVSDGNNYAGSYITQTADIDLGNKEWTPIGTSGKPFCGVYNAQDHKITGLSITKATRFLGLFGYIKSTTAEAGIANLTLEGSINIDSDFAGATDAGVGALVGWVYQDGNDLTNRVKIVNITSNVSINITGLKNQLRIGGVAGYSYCADYENVVHNANITISTAASARVGGVIGQGNRSTYTGCVNNGKVTVNATGSGVWADVAAIIAVPTVKKDSDGAIVGVKTTLTNCVNNGELKATTESGKINIAGITAEPYHGGTNTTNYIKVDSCVNTADIVGTRTDKADYVYAGGILAYNNKKDVEIVNCVNSGEVKAEAGSKSNGGGIVGVMNNSDESCFVKDCISANSIVGYSAQPTDKTNSTANADAKDVSKAVKAVEKKLTPSKLNIGGFDTAYKAPVEEKPSNPSTGDCAVVLAFIAVISLAGVAVAKKSSVR